MRSTLISFFGTAVLGLLLIGGVNAQYRTVERELIAHQKAKLDRRADVVFVGDSSLGNSLDAELASRLSGKVVANLALTGAYAVPGCLEMLQQYIARHGAPQQIWIVQAIDVLERQIDARRVAQTLRDASLFESAFKLVDLREATAATQQALLLQGQDPLDGDYIRQAAPLHAADIPADLKLLPVSLSNVKALRSIANLCRTHGIRCALAIGPNARKQEAVARAYIETIPKVLPAAVRLEGRTPFWIDDDQLGDSPNHVHPRYRAQYTEKWACLIAPRAGCRL